eukprot:5622395-Pleurochrysis_carterae.AAC.1
MRSLLKGAVFVCSALRRKKLAIAEGAAQRQRPRRCLTPTGSGLRAIQTGIGLAGHEQRAPAHIVAMAVLVAAMRWVCMTLVVQLVSMKAALRLRGWAAALLCLVSYAVQLVPKDAVRRIVCTPWARGERVRVARRCHLNGIEARRSADARLGPVGAYLKGSVETENSSLQSVLQLNLALTGVGAETEELGIVQSACLLTCTPVRCVPLPIKCLRISHSMLHTHHGCVPHVLHAWHHLP